MSPEMIKAEPHTYKLDIWALGILLFEMIHGTPPFRARNPKEMLNFISSNKYTIGNHVSRLANQLIQSLLQFDPESRASIEEILASP